jgi:hypothetical protein
MDDQRSIAGRKFQEVGVYCRRNAESLNSA